MAYQASLRDIQFVREEMLGSSDYYQSTPEWREASPDLVSAIFDECAKFCENELAPLNRAGDTEGCQYNDGEVKTPTGFKQAYEKFIEGGGPRWMHLWSTAVRACQNRWAL